MIPTNSQKQPSLPKAQASSLTDQFKYEQAVPLQLHDLVKSLLVCSKNSTPYFPSLFARKICQNQGLQCNQNVFFNLIANVIDFKMDQCITEIKDNVSASNKHAKDLTLKTVDVQKYFIQEKQGMLARPRLYPPVDVNTEADVTTMPSNQ